MKVLYKIILILIIVITLSACLSDINDANHVNDVNETTDTSQINDADTEQSQNKYEKNINCIYFEPKDFYSVRSYELKDVGTIRGCIVPHHLTATNLIHEVFQNASKNSYETVVVFGPDHESTDMGKVFTTDSNYQTPFGALKTDEEVVNSLTDLEFVKLSDEKMANEHSTSGLVPYIKYYQKDANVVTLAITKQTKLSDIDLLVDKLLSNVDAEKTLFIASIDFSHYLTLDEADKMDEISNEAILNKDTDRILKFTNDNLDSPLSVVTMLKLMDKSGVENILNVNHSNSQLIMKREVPETTSYLTYIFY